MIYREAIILVILLELPLVALVLKDISVYLYNKKNHNHWTYYNMGQKIDQ